MIADILAGFLFFSMVPLMIGYFGTGVWMMSETKIDTELFGESGMLRWTHEVGQEG
ncbi:MAG: hypothetical protein J6386_11710 [Candidatus Synoicihabitans palmerolidicus]|nr:hypothetical protein [Candidatus Synoicihabitans palmerolidicus]